MVNDLYFQAAPVLGQNCVSSWLLKHCCLEPFAHAGVQKSLLKESAIKSALLFTAV